MARLSYQDFYFRKLALGRAGVKSVPESKEAFLRRVDQFFRLSDKKIVTVETREDGIRVWYQE